MTKQSSLAFVFALTCVTASAHAETDFCGQLKQLRAAAASDFGTIASAPSLDGVSWTTSLILAGAQKLDCTILPPDEREPALYSCRWRLGQGQDAKATEEARKLAQAVHACLGGAREENTNRIDARWSVFPDGKPTAGNKKLRIEIVANSGAARSPLFGTKRDGPAGYELSASVTGPPD